MTFFHHSKEGKERYVCLQNMSIRAGVNDPRLKLLLIKVVCVIRSQDHRSGRKCGLNFLLARSVARIMN